MIKTLVFLNETYRLWLSIGWYDSTGVELKRSKFYHFPSLSSFLVIMLFLQTL